MLRAAVIDIIVVSLTLCQAGGEIARFRGFHGGRIRHDDVETAGTTSEHISEVIMAPSGSIRSEGPDGTGSPRRKPNPPARRSAKAIDPQRSTQVANPQRLAGAVEPQRSAKATDPPAPAESRLPKADTQSSDAGVAHPQGGMRANARVVQRADRVVHRADYDALLSELGRRIATGKLPAGTVMTLADLEGEFKVSRTLVRDVVKVLEGLGMVTSRRRVGVTVESRENWQLLDPHVIAWRMYDADERRHHLLEISELRRGLEPEAARLAAQRGLPGADRLVDLAERMRDLGAMGCGSDPEFLAADTEFHELIATLSGNEIFARLGAMTGALLVERTHWDLQPAYPDAEAVRHHIRLALAIRDGKPETAAESASFIVTQAADEVGDGETQPSGGEARSSCPETEQNAGETQQASGETRMNSAN